jgi:DNA mismatch repair protein MutL
MSSIIRLLPDNIANQIAAGEVIQRPASVVKELLENAVDAGADKIHLLIRDGGRTLIQVVDNGKGMSEEDAHMCFERHATSKLSSAEDLFRLQTKGFRGEALASVAAIAHVELITKQKENELAFRLEIEGSEVKNTEPCMHGNGTTFSIKNLFYNVPARRNFLKSDQIENGHITEEFERLALVHPEIEFTFSSNDTQIFTLPKTNLKKRIADVFGKNYEQKLVPIETFTDIVEISGFVVKPEFAKKKRGDQYFFVNDRYFKDNYLNHSVTAAFENLIAERAFPAYFIYLKVPMASIDVNVHPTKTEIKFEEDRAIYQLLKSTIKQALGKFHIAPSLDFSTNPDFEIPSFSTKTEVKSPEINVTPGYNPFKIGAGIGVSYSSTSNQKMSGFKIETNSKMAIDNFFEVSQEEMELLSISSNELEINESIEQNRNLLFDQKKGMSQHIFTGTHIILMQKELMLIHASRARQRILYDQLMQSFMIQPIASQKLLFPIEKEVNKKELLIWETNHKNLVRIGFSWTISNETVNINGIPACVREVEAMACIDELLVQLMNTEIEPGEIAHTLINTLAFSASRTKIDLNQYELRSELLHNLFESKEHNFTPNGLKIITSLTIDELNARF